ADGGSSAETEDGSDFFVTAHPRRVYLRNMRSSRRRSPPGRFSSTAAVVVSLAAAASLASTSDASAWCTKRSTLDGIAARFPGHLGPDRVVRTNVAESLRAAIDAAQDDNGDGYIIVAAVRNADGKPYGTASQRVVV